MSCLSNSKSQVLQKCLYNHRNLIKANRNPYTLEAKTLSLTSQTEALTICEQMRMSSETSYQSTANEGAFRKSFEAMITIMNRVIAVELAGQKTEIISRSLIFACERVIKAMATDLFRFTQFIIDYVSGLADAGASTFMKRVRLEVLIDYWRKNNPLFICNYGGACYRIMIVYFRQQPKNLPLHKRNQSIVSVFGKLASAYILGVANKKQQNLLVTELIGFQVLHLLQLPLLMRQLINKQSSRQVSIRQNERTSSRQNKNSKDSRTSKSSIRSIPRKEEPNTTKRIHHSSFRSSQRGSKIHRPSQLFNSKRLSCQPDLLGQVDFQKFYSNNQTLRGNIDEEPLSDEFEDNTKQNCLKDEERQPELRIYSSKNTDVSSKTLSLNGFFQFLRVEGLMRLLMIYNIQSRNLIGDIIEVSFRLRYSKININQRLYLSRDDPIVTKHRRIQDGIREGLADKIRTNITLRRTLLGYTISMTGRMQQQTHKIQKSSWLQLIQHYNSFYFESFIFEKGVCLRRLYDTLLKQKYEESSDRNSLQPKNMRINYEINLCQEEYLLTVECQTTGMQAIKTGDYSLTMMNCSNRHNRPKKVVKKQMSNERILNPFKKVQLRQQRLKAQLLIQKECINKLKETCHLNMKLGQRVLISIDGIVCEAHLISLNKTPKNRRSISLEVILLTKKTKKFVINIDEFQVKEILKRNYPLCGASNNGLRSILSHLHFKRSYTYSSLSLDNSIEPEIIIDKFTIKTNTSYAVANLSFLRHFKLIALALYMPSEGITLQCTLTIAEFANGFQFLIDPDFSFEKLTYFPDVLKEIRSGLEVIYLEEVTIRLFGRQLQSKILLTTSTLQNCKKSFRRNIYLSEIFTSAPVGDLSNKHMEVREIGMSVVTRDRSIDLPLTKSLTTYYQNHRDQLLNPIRPDPMDLDCYRFCLADLRKLARQFDSETERLNNSFYIFVNGKLHQVVHNNSAIRVVMCPDREVCLVQVQEATNKIPFFDEVTKNVAKRSRFQKRLKQSLNIAFPALYLSR